MCIRDRLWRMRMQMLKLNKSNYFSQEASFQYMSNSQYKNFMSCEAMAIAELSGNWIREPSDALLIGSYVHSWQEGRRREFISEHPEMFKKSKELLKKFVDADKMIKTLEGDPFVMYVLEGQKEVILTDKCLSLIHISEPTRLGMISYAVFCLKK